MKEFNDQCPLCGFSPAEIMEGLVSGIYEYALQVDPEIPAKDVENNVREWLADEYNKGAVHGQELN